MTRKLNTLASQPLVRKLTPRPEPQTFLIEEPIDPSEWRWAIRNGATEQELLRRLHRHMTLKLADHLAEKCKAFEFDFNRLMRERIVSIEITIDDRGTYEGLVDSAERAGRRQGIKEATDAMPYGLNDLYE